MIHPPEAAGKAAAGRLAAESPAFADLAVFFGEIGGGLQYAVGPDGAVRCSRTASEESEFDRIANGLAEFLDLLRRSVHRFNESGQPGYV